MPFAAGGRDPRGRAAAARQAQLGGVVPVVQQGLEKDGEGPETGLAKGKERGKGKDCACWGSRFHPPHIPFVLSAPSTHRPRSASPPLPSPPLLPSSPSFLSPYLLSPPFLPPSLLSPSFRGDSEGGEVGGGDRARGRAAFRNRVCGLGGLGGGGGGGGVERAGEAAHGGALRESCELSNMNQIVPQGCEAIRSPRQARAPARQRVRRRGVSTLDSI